MSPRPRAQWTTASWRQKNAWFTTAAGRKIEEWTKPELLPTVLSHLPSELTARLSDSIVHENVHGVNNLLWVDFSGICNHFLLPTPQTHAVRGVEIACCHIRKPYRHIVRACCDSAWLRWLFVNVIICSMVVIAGRIPGMMESFRRRKSRSEIRGKDSVEHQKRSSTAWF